MDAFTSTDRYTLACRRCGRRWQAEYEVRQHHLADMDMYTYWQHGHQVVPPTSGIRCPHCGGLRVAVLPSGSTPLG
jgi:hypothetical protein